MGAQFFSPLFGGITNTPPTMEYPQLYNSWSKCKDGGSVVASLHDCAKRRAQVNLSYSANGPDMFGLVTSILQEPSEQEPITDWNSLSRLFPPFWTLDLENNDRCSRLFPTKALDNEKLANLVDTRRPYEEKLEKASSAALLNRKLGDLHVTSSWPAPSNPCSPSSDEVLRTSDPEAEVFTCNSFSQQAVFAPECSYDKKQVDIVRGNLSSSQPKSTNSTNFYEERQETNTTGGVLGASDVEESSSFFIQLPNSAVGRVWDPVIQENHLCAKRCACESPRFPYFLSPPFGQENSIPEGVNAKLHENYQQSCPNNMGVDFDNTEMKTPAYPPQDSSNHLSPNPGQQRRNSSYSGDIRLQSHTLNPATTSYVSYRKQKRINSLSHVCSVSHSIGQPSCSQIASRKDGTLLVGTNASSHLGFSNCKENLKPHNSVGCSRDHLRAPTQEHLREISTNISSGSFSRPPSANASAKCYRFVSLPHRGHAGERTGWNEGRRKTNRIPPRAASVGPDWAQLGALRRKPNEANSSDFINPSFLPLFPLVPGYTKIPNFPAMHPPRFSPSTNVAFPPLPLSELVDDFPHLSPFINDLFCGDVAAPYLAFPPRLDHYRSAKNRGGPARELHIHLEECYEQWRALERERKKVEADLARTFPGKSLSSSNSVPFSRLPAKPSRVDRLILDQFQEQARVHTLLGKMERLCGIPIHGNIWATLGHHLEAIYTTQTRRKEEIVNAGNPQRPGTSCATNEKDVLALAAAVKELASFTRKTRTALWCAFQMALPKILASPPVHRKEVQRALRALGPASVSLQTKVLGEGEDKENERVN
ncbi:uncharacterized protein LOC112542562 [Python bivittatus]|uniref:Uncharacterized protein LOC112542562 n=1 Tax=Python bivittatus TaxID=176946 RepID=A0A9F5J010_PYTBI|nr:uncharacterized protein LOC112542562 [Python bivittatus]XP_025031560.1 uncharacterized protein LOC112542562 [Python bivittatus]